MLVEWKKIKHSIFIYAMIKFTKVNNKKYIAIVTDIESGESIAPVQIQINVSHLSEDEQYKIYQTASLLLNRTIKRPIFKAQPSKPWWKIW
jgi:hypothetical protein